MNSQPEVPGLQIAPDSRGAVSTRLHGRYLVVARVVWAAITVSAIALLVLSVPSRFEHFRVLCTAAPCPVPPQLSPAGEQVLVRLGLSVDVFAAYLTTVHVVVACVYFATGAIIFWRRSDDWLAIFASLAVSLPGLVALPFLDALAATYPAWRAPVDMVRSIALGVSILHWYIFPSGEFVSRWTRVLAVLLVAWTLIWPFTPVRYPSIGWFAVLLGWLGTGSLAQIYRYRKVANAVERQQTKWVIFGGTVLVAGLVLGVLLPPVIVPSLFPNFMVPISSFPSLVYQVVVIPIVALGSTLAFPIAFAIATLRFRLWEVDPIINRTLVYGTLTAVLLALYFGSIALFQQLVRNVTQQESSLVVVGSTLAIAALFQPLRGRIQLGIDRRFYRRKYDAVRTLQSFSAHLRDDINLDQLKVDLLATVEETLEPAHVSLWLREVPTRGPVEG